MRRLTFRRCGWAGVGCAGALALALAGESGLSVWLEGTLVVVACLTFLTLAGVTRRVARRERLVYYHHEIVVLTVVGAVSWAAGAPVLAHLDATALGLGAFLVCGRIGCLVAGCCHGRPASRGVVYGPEHAAHGFTRHLVGVPLVPVQAIEAGLALGIVGLGSMLVLGGRPAGTGFALYVGAYAVVRFFLEFLRGDPLRPYWRGVSEAQWTSVALALLVAVGGLAGALPRQPWHEAAALGLLAALAVALWVARRPPALLHPRHVQEVARTVASLSAPGAGPARVARTSAGVRLSCGRDEERLHVSLSAERAPLSASEAGALARLIGTLGRRADVELVGGPGGVWHVLMDS